ncbi:MAG: PPC domain-containing protein [Chroococcidiopsidaceae cyanobacterium CP_BM_RX_35]|nr:PPC domain-containing protein [Chroococcidiopsidaceae cyanobacterium CP_BM_RX_35]
MSIKAFAAELNLLLAAPLLVVSVIPTTSIAQGKLYSPIPLPPSNQVSDKLSDKDIPTGQGGFARDYSVKLHAGDNVAIELTSDSFDTIVTLLAPNGSTVGENDDGPDGTTNSLLFVRITKTGTYTVRVHAFGETGVGPFKLKLSRLRPIQSNNH